ncbi:4'-phosphopantetheinyl transferase family protein [Gorillibacterium massiliense]|uniref:4'-phosphopantetheinyl transferase family protein n=1 Tax=Gorillibacterium massiliense TaxID=1280390 RepID=UPI0005949DBB|nr:4'-phosphopantetheinyl transferase superfamily protein [Gorillibacterium massiliense]
MITVTQLDSLDAVMFEQALSCLPHPKQDRIRRYRQKADQIRSLLAEIAVRLHIMQKRNLDARQLIFDTNPYGKPYLAGSLDFHYNVSHSGEWVACIFDSSPVGIDVEKIVPIDMAISESFFTSSEHEDLLRLPNDERLSYFFTLWTLKESFIKAVGKGLSIPLRSFSFFPSADEYADFTLQCEKPVEQDYYFKQYSIDPDYKLAVCTTHTRFAAAPLTFTASELCERFLTLNSAY